VNSFVEKKWKGKGRVGVRHCVTTRDGRRRGGRAAVWGTPAAEAGGDRDRGGGGGCQVGP
jgi:hypothetical protein